MIPITDLVPLFAFTLYGAILEGRDEHEAQIVYPGMREELVEDALRKITVSNSRGRYDEMGGFVRFTMYELQRELAAHNHKYGLTQIKEALNILHLTRIVLETEDGSKIASGYLLPSPSRLCGSFVRRSQAVHQC